MNNEKVNHYCAICGNGYWCCISCEDKNIVSWRYLTDTIDHFKIYTVLCDYRDCNITKQEAKKLLYSIRIDGWENFKDSAKNLISEILSGENNLNSDDLLNREE